MPTTKLLKKGENLLWGFGKLIKKIEIWERKNERTCRLDSSIV